MQHFREPDLSAPSNLSSTTTDPGVADKAGADKAGPTKQKETPPQPFIIGEGLPAVPMKLVTKIQKGKFVDTARRGLLGPRYQTGSTGGRYPICRVGCSA